MDFLTPIKETIEVRKQNQTASQIREGDWVCLNCNNFNFSFRKKCNRCKSQTKQQNEVTSAYSYYYYSKQYVCLTIPNEQHKELPRTPTSTNSPPQHIFLTPREDKQNQTPPKGHKPSKDLPSVSPLVRKYNSRENTPSQSSNHSSSRSVWGIRDFDQYINSSNKKQKMQENDDDQGDELQKLIGKIML